MTPTGMSITSIPLRAPDPETGEWVEIGLHLLPEYHAREAARFAGIPWPRFVRLKSRHFADTVGHWMAHTLFSMHTQDAHALEAERRQKQHEAEAAVKGRSR